MRRKWIRQFEIHTETLLEKVDILKQGVLNKTDRDAVAFSAKQVLSEMEKIAGKDLVVDDVQNDLRAKLENLRGEVSASTELDAQQTSPLAHLSAKEREMYEHLFSLICECSVNRTVAKALVDRIVQKITA